MLPITFFAPESLDYIIEGCRVLDTQLNCRYIKKPLKTKAEEIYLIEKSVHLLDQDWKSEKISR